MPGNRATFAKRGAIALVAALSAAAIGYGSGHSSKRTLDPATGHWDGSRAPESLEPPDAAGTQSASDRATRLATLKQRLIQQWRSSPEPLKDLELQDETHRQLATLSARELADFYHSLDSQFMPDLRLRQTVLKEWALKDGPAAVTQSESAPGTPYNAISAFDTWGYRDPHKALAWLRETDLPPMLKDQVQTIRLNFLLDLAQSDFAQVSEELTHLDAKERLSILRTLGGAIENRPDLQERIRELAKNDADPASALSLERALISQQAKSDPDAALKHIAELNLSAADKADLEAGLVGASYDNPEKSFGDWMARNPDIQAVPESLLPMMDARYALHPEEMTHWMDSLSPGPLRDSFYERGTRLVASRGQFDKAATYADGISDPPKRLAAMRTLRTMWTGADPEKSKAWIQALPDADRKALGE